MSESHQRRLSAILSADMVGYSRHMEQDEAGTVERLKADRAAVVDPAIRSHGGRLFYLAGDGALVEFPSVVEATQCAIDIQRAMVERNAARPDGTRAVFRIGVNLGDVIVDGDDLHGEGINVAARLQALAEPGGILLSEDVARQVEGKVSARIEFVDERALKNIERLVRTWHVVLDDTAQTRRDPTSTQRHRMLRHGVLVLSAVVLGLGAFLWVAPLSRDPEPAAPATSLEPVPDELSIAVLPFDNLSNDPEQEYFVDGMTEDIITDLSILGGLAVIARNSSFQYKGRPVDVRAVGRELGVRYVLEGSVRKVAGRIRVNAQLVATDSGTHLWAERFDEELTDIFVVQDRVIRRIVSALSIQLTPDQDEKLAAPATDNPEAYDEFLKGQSVFLRFTTDRYDEARRHFRRAIELDPNFARAYSALSVSYANEVLNGLAEDSDAALQQAMDMARTAVALDSSLPQAYFVLGYAHLFRREHPQAIEAVERAIELAPSYADAYLLLAFMYLHSGRVDAAFPLVEHGMRLNPNYPAEYLGIQAQAYYWQGNLERAVEQFRLTLERNPTYVLMQVMLVAALSAGDQVEEADWEAEELLALNPGFSVDGWIADRPFIDQTQAERLAEDLRRAGLD
jgi:TolB-like protein/class 3 adenylate cyclase/Tfp pilus assembly protein PilF